MISKDYLRRFSYIVRVVQGLKKNGRQNFVKHFISNIRE